MTFSKLHRTRWQGCFDELSKTLQREETPRYVTLRAAASGEIGSRAVAPRLGFEQLAYDPAADTLNVHLDDFAYRIDYPTSIWTAVKDDGDLVLLVILRLDGTRDYIGFMRRLP